MLFGQLSAYITTFFRKHDAFLASKMCIFQSIVRSRIEENYFFPSLLNASLIMNGFKCYVLYLYHRTINKQWITSFSKCCFLKTKNSVRYSETFALPCMLSTSEISLPSNCRSSASARSSFERNFPIWKKSLLWQTSQPII